MPGRIAALTLGWLLGLLTFWLVASIAVARYEYWYMDPAGCAFERQTGARLGPWTEPVPGQPDSCFRRTARLHLP